MPPPSPSPSPPSSPLLCIPPPLFTNVTGPALTGVGKVDVSLSLSVQNVEIFVSNWLTGPGPQQHPSLRLHLLRGQVRPGVPPQQAHQDSHRGETLRLREVRQELRSPGQTEAPHGPSSLQGEQDGPDEPVTQPGHHPVAQQEDQAGEQPGTEAGALGQSGPDLPPPGPPGLQQLHHDGQQRGEQRELVGSLPHLQPGRLPAGLPWHGAAVSTSERVRAAQRDEDWGVLHQATRTMTTTYPAGAGLQSDPSQHVLGVNLHFLVI